MKFHMCNPLNLDPTVHDSIGRTNKIRKKQSKFCPIHGPIKSSEHNKNANELICSTEYTRAYKACRLDNDNSEEFHIIWDILYASKSTAVVIRIPIDQNFTESAHSYWSH